MVIELHVDELLHNIRKPCAGVLFICLLLSQRSSVKHFVFLLDESSWCFLHRRGPAVRRGSSGIQSSWIVQTEQKNNAEKHIYKASTAPL